MCEQTKRWHEIRGVSMFMRFDRFYTNICCVNDKMAAYALESSRDVFFFLLISVMSLQYMATDRHIQFPPKRFAHTTCIR